MLECYLHAYLQIHIFIPGNNYADDLSQVVLKDRDIVLCCITTSESKESYYVGL